MRRIVCFILIMMLVFSCSISAKEKEVTDVVMDGESSIVDTHKYSENINKEDMVTTKGKGDYYYFDDSSIPTGAGGGTLVSHTERQRYGTLSGTVRKFQFYLYSKYEGTKTVERIKASWTVTAKMRSQATLTLSTSLSTNSATISAGTSSTWQNVSLNKYYISTNGTKMVYDQSNFTCAPDSDLYSYEVSLVTESSVKLKSDAKTYTISSGC